MIILTGTIAGSLFLYGIFLIAYYAAWSDFKPKKVDMNEEFALAQRASESLEPLKRTRPFSDRELGLISIDEAPVDRNEQYRRQMRERVAEMIAENPEATANVLQGWMSR